MKVTVNSHVIVGSLTDSYQYLKMLVISGNILRCHIRQQSSL